MSINTDEAFQGVLTAVGVQAAFGQINGVIRDLTGTKDETDGFILGDKESGDADSGITMPTIEAVFREVAAVAGSFTEQADSFQKADVTGFNITFALQGNGASATPSVGEADLATLLPAFEAIFETAGLIGVVGGGGAEQDYRTRIAGDSGGATIYTTWKIWHGDLEFVFSDCLIETMTLTFTPGGNCIVSCDVVVGTFDHTVAVDVDAFPTVTFGPQTDNAAPVVEGVAFIWGEQHGFESLEIVIRNTIGEFGDSNVPTTGVRRAQTRREVEVTGTIYVETTDSDFHFQNVVSSTAPVSPGDDLSFQVGTPAGSSDTINAFKIKVNKLQGKGVKYNRVGSAMVAELTASKATGTAGGTEFEIEMN